MYEAILIGGALIMLGVTIGFAIKVQSLLSEIRKLCSTIEYLQLKERINNIPIETEEAFFGDKLVTNSSPAIHNFRMSKGDNQS